MTSGVPQSFDNITNWIKNIKQHASGAHRSLAAMDGVRTWQAGLSSSGGGAPYTRLGWGSRDNV